MAQLELLSVRDWQVLRLSTDEMSLDIVPGLGATIVSLRRLRDGLDLLWRSPWGLRQRGALRLPGASDALMMDTFAGGWQTLFPNAGKTVNAHGVEWGADGEVRVSPFDWEHSGDSVIFRTRLVRSPFELTKTITARGSTVTVAETVRNVGGQAVEVIWGQQVIFGPPLLDPDTVVDAAAAVVHPEVDVSQATSYDDITPWPRTLGADSMVNLRNVPGDGSYETRQAYLDDFHRPLVTLSNPGLDLAVDLEWNLEAFPYLWYSLEAGGRADFPWYHRGYFLALTPCSGWPAHGLRAARRVSSSTLWIDADAELTSHLTMSLRAIGTPGP